MLKWCALMQPPDSMLGAVDGTVLDRLAKIMSYMRPSERGKNSKKLRKKDKLAMLNGQALDEDMNGAAANGHDLDDGSVPLPPSGPPPKVCPSSPAEESWVCLTAQELPVCSLSKSESECLPACLDFYPMMKAVGR